MFYPQDSDISIKRAELCDIPQIAEIEQVLFKNPWDEQGFRDALFYYSALFFTAMRGSEVVGFVCGGMEDTGEAVYGHIMNIGVKSEMQGHGIGGRLLQRVEYEALVLGAAGVQLEVRVSNTKAQAVYQRMGYSQVFLLGGYYPDGEDAVIMMKWFEYDDEDS